MTTLPAFPGISTTIAQADRRPTEIYARFFDRLVKALSERFSIASSDVAPTIDDIPAGEFRVHKNTTTNVVVLAVNDGGVIKTIEFT